jgi:hypothetical protein
VIWPSDAKYALTDNLQVSSAAIVFTLFPYIPFSSHAKFAILPFINTKPTMWPITSTTTNWRTSK